MKTEIIKFKCKCGWEFQYNITLTTEGVEDCKDYGYCLQCGKLSRNERVVELKRGIKIKKLCQTIQK